MLSGLLVLVPIYLVGLLIAKAIRSLDGVVKPVAKLIGIQDWLFGGVLLASLLIVFVCFLVGLLVHTHIGQLTQENLEQRVLQRIPGYTTFRSLTQRLLGDSYDQAWKPALAEIEEAFVPAFIIEELSNGSFTVFVPSVPTPLAGSVYILTPDRVHPVNVPFRHAVRVLSQWGAGAKDLLAAMEDRLPGQVPSTSPPMVQERGRSH